ncbi:MAG TPA: metallophosphoesterase [Coleofasciculaceae cyanobacterium]|jgi:predicted phosphodiesterase
MKRRFTWLLLIGLVFSLCFSCYAVDRAKVKPSKEISTTASSLEHLYLPPRKDFRIVVISDLNSQYGSTEYEPEIEQAIALMPQWQPDLVLCGGDMIAGQKASLTKAQIEQMWAAFELHVAAPLRKYQIPFGFTIGNHDGSGAIKDRALIFERERDLARAYWNRNQHQLSLDFIDRANFPFFYSFHQNDVFLLVWDASTQDISDKQLDWVQTTLNSPAAQQAKARIVVGHLPLYPVAKTKNQPGEYLADGEMLRSLLEQNQVDIYISGHHHAYYPGKKGKLKLLHAGALGQGARQLINSELPATKTITIVDLDLSRFQIAYTTYNAETWELISLAQLPISIPSDYGKILRHDL